MNTMTMVLILTAGMLCLLWLLKKIGSIQKNHFHRVQMQEESLANLSHELRKILTPMKGYVDLILSGRTGGLNEQQSRFIKNVSENLDRMHKLVGTLLDLNFLENSSQDFDLKWINLENILQEVAQEYRVIADSKKLQIHISTKGDLNLYGDPEKLWQVFSNLVANAVHYTLEGEIQIKVYQDGSDLYVEIQDTGIGIPLKDQERIFERFYRSSHDHVQKIAGNGLGLSIAHAIIEKHRGKIGVESVPGKGSNFTIVLPKEKRKNRRKTALRLAS